MKLRNAMPLPGFVLNPITALVIAAVHVYLAAGHLSKLFGGEITWTNIWKGFGALAGAYVFAALASRGLTKHEGQLQCTLKLDSSERAQGYLP
jgi:hypothetical protein